MTAARRWLLSGIAVLLAVAASGLGAGPASAHPTLLFTEPAGESAVAESPQQITLLFNEPVTIGERAIVLLDRSGRELPVGAATTARDGQFVTAGLTESLEPGTYTVRWRVTGVDGDLVEEDFRFAVGTALSGAASAGVISTPAWGDAALRWLLFAGLAIAFGGLVAGRFTAAAVAEQPALPRLRSWVPAGVSVALAGVAGLAAKRAIDAGDIATMWQGQAGAVLMAEAGALAATLVVLALHGRGWALVPLTIVVAAEGIRSHAGVAAGGWGAALTAMHLAAIALWVGALVQTARAVVAWRHMREAVRWVLRSYIRLAVWTYVAVFATGAVSVLVILPLPQLVSTTYGRVVLVKLALVAAVSAAALTARLVQRDPGRFPLLSKAMRVESGLLAVVLAASAVLVSTAPVAGAPQPAPPEATGPVLPLGALAGQVGVDRVPWNGVNR